MNKVEILEEIETYDDTDCESNLQQVDELNEKCNQIFWHIKKLLRYKNYRDCKNFLDGLSTEDIPVFELELFTSLYYYETGHYSQAFEAITAIDDSCFISEFNIADYILKLQISANVDISPEQLNYLKASEGVEACWLLGLYYRYQDNLEDARKLYEQALQLQRRSYEANKYMAMLLLEVEENNPKIDTYIKKAQKIRTDDQLECTKLIYYKKNKPENEWRNLALEIIRNSRELNARIVAKKILDSLGTIDERI